MAGHKATQKPDIAGGRTLAKMRRGRGRDGGGKKHGRKGVWFQAGKDKGEGKGKLGSWPGGEMPPEVKARVESNNS